MSTAKRKLLPIEVAWDKWRDCLEGRDRNSIFNQIFTLIWDAGIYRIILECRKSYITEGTNTPKLNFEFQSFLDRNYFQTMASSIRRIVDDGYSISGPRGVFSLSSITKDIKSYNYDLTRKKFFELRKIEYNFDNLCKKEQQFIRSESQKNNGEVTIPPDVSPYSSIENHLLFDKLSQKNPDNRSEEDVISSSFWDLLEYKIDSAKKLCDYVDKFIAHAANPESRIQSSYTSEIITIENCWAIQKNLCEVFDILTNIILGVKVEYLLFEKPSFYEYWDSPINPIGLSLIEDTFSKYRSEIEGWNFKWE